MTTPLLPCGCSHSDFSDKHHGHIITGDLRLIKNNKLRKLFAKGPKYRETKFIDWNAVESSMLQSVRDCAQSWCDKSKKDIIILRSWIAVVSEKIKSKISSLKKSSMYKEVNEVLKSADCLKALHDLHSKFVIVPIDKASGNIAFVCKTFYAQVLVNELGLNGLSKCKTYEQVSNSNINNIVEKDCSNLSKKFNLTVPESSKQLPHMYWLPKLHKRENSYRY